MKKVLFAFAALAVLAACGDKQISVPTEEGNALKNEVNTEVSSEVKGEAAIEESAGVEYEIAKNYFFKNGQEIPASPKISKADVFDQLFGMATVMGADGMPTEIDFSHQFVLAIVLPVTDIATEIIPVNVEDKGDTLVYTYEVKTGQKQSYSIQPMSLIILDKQYENKEVVLVSK
ncbi:MAG: hypothetical protein K5856_05055 [Bacteroidaceae bacterium]|nr:hypothetical protein [Bacteroidaceae bacterium]